MVASPGNTRPTERLMLPPSVRTGPGARPSSSPRWWRSFPLDEIAGVTRRRCRRIPVKMSEKMSALPGEITDAVGALCAKKSGGSRPKKRRARTERWIEFRDRTDSPE